MLHYVKAFTMQVVPSVAATIIGAYIVNHYIVAPKTGTDAPASAVAARTKPAAKPAPEAKPAETTGDVASLPEAGVKAKGISEKALLEKNAAAEKAVVEKPADKDAVVEKPAEAVSAAHEPRRQQPAPPREKTAAVRVIPLTPSQSVTSTPATPAPVVSAPASVPATEAAVAPEEHRDANDLARAAIERLRTGDNAGPRQKEAARAPDASRAPEAARSSEASRVSIEPALRPLPPPIMVSAPPADTGSIPRVYDPQRPTPPGEIPTLRPPLDLRAEMGEPKREKPSVVDDVLSATKSVFNSVLPK